MGCVDGSGPPSGWSPPAGGISSNQTRTVAGMPKGVETNQRRIQKPLWIRREPLELTPKSRQAPPGKSSRLLPLEDKSPHLDLFRAFSDAMLDKAQ
mmetsp:Transcript_53927/g.121128  ORF Transcript_53927/g.121128 Transcript_53927/m.121128 type:complete len:96 (+) Transcript_53927:1556-1843(+)